MARRFRWETIEGEKLRMTWRYEQPFYERWGSGFITHDGTTGLIAVDIQP